MNAHRPQRAAARAASLLVALIAYAGPKDFWETKPYTEWSAKEVERLLLKDSPWTQTLLLDAPPTSVNIGSTSTGADRPSRGGGATKIIVNWYARPIREAVVRQMMLLRPDTPKERLDAILNHRPQFHELLVTGLSLGRAREGSGEFARFKEKTYLEKKNKEKLPLVNVIVPRGRDQATTLQFPKEIEGKPTVTPEDKEVTLVILIGEKTCKFKFKLAEMTIGDRLEL